MVSSLNGIGSFHPTMLKTTARTVWKYSHADFEKANELPADIDWEKLLDTTDVNQALRNWEGTYMTIMESCIPKCTPPKHKNLPWLSKNLKQVMRKQNNLFKRAKSSGSAELWSKYKGMQNKFTSILRNSKQSFFYKKHQQWKQRAILEDNELSQERTFHNPSAASRWKI